jgi:hypothetical protein
MGTVTDFDLDTMSLALVPSPISMGAVLGGELERAEGAFDDGKEVSDVLRSLLAVEEEDATQKPEPADAHQRQDDRVGCSEPHRDPARGR